MFQLKLIGVALALVVLFSCKDDDDDMNLSNEPMVNFTFQFNSTQERLDNLGNPAPIPAGNAAQTPRFNSMSAHYVELAPTKFTPVGSGSILYEGPTNTLGGAEAVDLDQAVVVGEQEVFLSVPIKDIPTGFYDYLRVSVTYQNYDIDLQAQGFNLSGTVASFVGFNTYITSHTVSDSTVVVNDDRLQGYWAFETKGSPVAVPVQSGQAPGTTVPNPIFNTSPIPPGSCLVTGEFTNSLEIKGTETEDINITVSLSINNSFEWKDNNPNGIWEPLQNEPVVDMGLRGLVPFVN